MYARMPHHKSMPRIRSTLATVEISVSHLHQAGPTLLNVPCACGLGNQANTKMWQPPWRCSISPLASVRLGGFTEHGKVAWWDVKLAMPNAGGFGDLVVRVHGPQEPKTCMQSSWSRACLSRNRWKHRGARCMQCCSTMASSPEGRCDRVRALAEGLRTAANWKGRLIGIFGST